ncbi:polysaccharide pyruvyl transferase CsaB [Cytobacillus firmus]|uniref:polysaccharide pyruvyl transferase CsaB n=1 Tax=Cytobacillus firmus TaxID=1399 RepID=UPI001CFCFCF2|nr:polysaccharide pyruvyl transferase CsaB [Cytobacillus firmus]
MKVVISGYYGFNNVGDEAILFSMIQVLQKVEPGIDITVLSNDPAYTEKTYHVRAVNRWIVKEVYRALKGSDGLISGGGSLLQDETGIKSIPYYTGVIKLAQIANKPVFIYAQGMGPIHKKISRMIVKNVLGGTEITVRDLASKKLLETIGIRRPIEIVPDPVIGLNLQNTENTWFNAQSFSGKLVTVSVRDWPSEVDYKKKIAAALDSIAGAGNSVIFVPMHGEHDDKASRDTAALMKEKSYISPFNDSIEAKIALIGKSNLLLGMRLHALIFSAITYTPFIALSYDPKIEAFADIAGQPVAGSVVNDNWEAASLSEAMKAALKKEGALSLNLRDRIEPLQDQATDTALKSIQYLKRNTK